MKEKKQIMILLLIIIQMGSFYSCRINNGRMHDNDLGSLDVLIKNNSQTTYYFNTIDMEHPSCRVFYRDDGRMIKDFYFSINPDSKGAKYDTTMYPSGFLYEIKPSDEIKLNIKLKEGFDDYYKVEFDESNGSISKSLMGQSKEKHFYIFYSPEPFCYHSHFSDYSRKLNELGIKLEGKQTSYGKIEFLID